MKIFKKNLVKMTMKMVGSLALFLGAMVIVPTSLVGSHQPKCPDELLK
ncbi:cyclic lactone autoinducer peptide [Clostridium thailandense]|uniref:Cyclic lactone autoinducer peptide n=1 Tax=Clostridium thailandense TaxID=2794346 RepID=A0A949U0A1_9CLOT|nr:cyclic lactone autoinducer peptide [Clostridium thailandense]MBV7273884.1 cyclic lactone autoinducer peptide [Clostridium thailandense]